MLFLYFIKAKLKEESPEGFKKGFEGRVSIRIWKILMKFRVFEGPFKVEQKDIDNIRKLKKFPQRFDIMFAPICILFDIKSVNIILFALVKH